MDKQDPLAHPLLQWYHIFILFLKTALSPPARGWRRVCGGRGGRAGKPVLQNLQGSVPQASEAVAAPRVSPTRCR